MKNKGTPKSSILIGFFHYKPSILGGKKPYFWFNTHIIQNTFLLALPFGGFDLATQTEVCQRYDLDSSKSESQNFQQKIPATRAFQKNWLIFQQGGKCLYRGEKYDESLDIYYHLLYLVDS